MGPVPPLDLNVTCKLFRIEIRSPEEASIRRTIVNLLETHPLPERIISAPDNIEIIDKKYLPLLKKEHKAIISHYRPKQTAERHSLNEVLRAHINSIRKFVKQKENKKAANELGGSGSRIRATTRPPTPSSSKSRKEKKRQKRAAKKAPMDSPMKRFKQKWMDPAYYPSEQVSSNHPADASEANADDDAEQLKKRRRISTPSSDSSSASESSSVSYANHHHAQSGPRILPFQSFSHIQGVENHQTQRMEGIEMEQTTRAFQPASNIVIKNEDGFPKDIETTKATKATSFANKPFDTKSTQFRKSSTPVIIKIKDEEDDDVSRFQRAISISSTSSIAPEEPDVLRPKHQVPASKTVTVKSKPAISFRQTPVGRVSSSTGSIKTAKSLRPSKNRVGEEVSDDTSARLKALGFKNTSATKEPERRVEKASSKGNQPNGHVDVVSSIPSGPQNPSTHQYQKHSSTAQQRSRSRDITSQPITNSHTRQDEPMGSKSSADLHQNPLYPSRYRPDYPAPSSHSYEDDHAKHYWGYSDDRREPFRSQPINSYEQRFGDSNRDHGDRRNDYHYPQHARIQPPPVRYSRSIQQRFDESRQDHYGYGRDQRHPGDHRPW